MPLRIDLIHHIKSVGVVPLGVTKKLSINEKGECYTKRRVTQDCSFSGPLGLSVNNWMTRDTLHPRFYGFCYLRILHKISAMHIKWTSKHILVGKIYLNAAY